MISTGNAFTTLKGIEFHWDILPQCPVNDTAEDCQQVLQFLRFSKSKYYNVPTTVDEFDHDDRKGKDAVQLKLKSSCHIPNTCR